MSTETPLNARRSALECLRCLRQDVPKGHTPLHILETHLEAYARAVLAEAERALRERAQEEVVEMKIAPHDSVGQGMAVGAHDAFVEAADLLAGMRGT